MLTVSEDVLAKARAHYAKMVKQPRLNFDSRRQVLLLRVIMGIIALLPSPLRKLGLRAKNQWVQGPDRRVKVRIIEPRGHPKAIVVDIHGGAWTTLHPVHDDPLTGPMAAEGFVVVSVDYRLAPEHPFEDVIGDCAAALAWVLTEAVRIYGVDKVLLHGDSAGAHLCLSSALRCRSMAQFGLLKGMALFFGAYDLSGTPSVRSASKETLLLNGPTLASTFSRMAGRKGDTALRDPAISPLYADLRGMPPALIIVGTADPLVDDSLLLADRLNEQAVTAEVAILPDAPHAFNRFPIGLADVVNGYARAWMSERAAAPAKRDMPSALA